VSNGLGYFTAFPGLGFRAGSIFFHRFGAYLGASSKWKRNLTLTYGVRYAREPGRSDSVFPPIPQLNALIPGLGNRHPATQFKFCSTIRFSSSSTPKCRSDQAVFQHPSDYINWANLG